MKATIKDVARLAGVSFKTVSRVINNEPTVGKDLQEKVWSAVKELNYQPNLSARQLRGAPSFIGFVYDNPNSHYVIDIQRGILNECRKQGFELVIHPCDAKHDDIHDEITAMVKRSHIAGLILTPPMSEMPSIVELLTELDVNFVRILSGSSEPDKLAPCVYIDDRKAGENITQYLIDLGHRNIGFLAGETEHKSSGERYQGYLDALNKNNIPLKPALVMPGEYSFESGVERTKRLLNTDEKPSAIFACNDEIAAGTLFAARLMGVSVPQNLSIVGFEDSPFSRQTWPKLTTAQQPNDTIAASAAAILIATVRGSKGEDEAQAIVNDFHPQLIVRDSTCPAPE